MADTRSGAPLAVRSDTSSASDSAQLLLCSDATGSEWRSTCSDSIADAIRRIREVHYDRGTIVNAMDIEAKEMADCRKRHDSFNKSELLRGKVGAYQLSQLGFFFVGDRNSPGKLRCSFCRRTIHMFTTEDAPYLEKDFDRRLIALLHRHSHLSATCPFSLGLNGDDKRFTADDIARVVEPLIRTQAVQLDRVESVQCLQWTRSLRIFAASLISQFPTDFRRLTVSSRAFITSQYSYSKIQYFYK